MFGTALQDTATRALGDLSWTHGVNCGQAFRLGISTRFKLTSVIGILYRNKEVVDSGDYVSVREVTFRDYT